MICVVCPSAIHDNPEPAPNGFFLSDLVVSLSKHMSINPGKLTVMSWDSQVSVKQNLHYGSQSQIWSVQRVHPFIPKWAHVWQSKSQESELTSSCLQTVCYSFSWSLFPSNTFPYRMHRLDQRVAVLVFSHKFFVAQKTQPGYRWVPDLVVCWSAIELQHALNL